jgi:hypothetical protein
MYVKRKTDNSKPHKNIGQDQILRDEHINTGQDQILRDEHINTGQVQILRDEHINWFIYYKLKYYH